jgi:hypothetical protein
LRALQFCAAVAGVEKVLHSLGRQRSKCQVLALLQHAERAQGLALSAEKQTCGRPADAIGQTVLRKQRGHSPGTSIVTAATKSASGEAGKAMTRA